MLKGPEQRSNIMKLEPRRCLSIFVVLFPVLDAIAVPRRRVINDGGALVMSGAAGLLCLVGHPQSAEAARGAAELDLEYYLRDIVGGNKREGTVSPSPAPPVPPPRELKDPLRSLLLNDSCNQDCLSTLALIEEVRLARAAAARPGEDPRLLEREIQKSMESYRDKAKNSFYAKAPWNKESVSDQYYFDLTSYALWRTAADLLPDYQNREKFVRRLGRFIYENGKQAGLLNAKPLQHGSLVGTKDCVVEILDAFRDLGACKGYRLGELVKKKEDERPLFDELDDDAISSGASVDCLVGVLEPATLGASLQITGEQSRFSPDFVGPTLAAMWETAGIQSTWETFFVDPEYRPNPKGTGYSILFGFCFVIEWSLTLLQYFLLFSPQTTFQTSNSCNTL